MTVWRGVETLFITSAAPKRHFLLMFGTWLFSEVQLCDSCLAKKKKKENISEHTFYFVAAGGVTQNLFWQNLLYSIWCYNAWTHVLFKGNRKAKKIICFLLMETWCSVDTNMPQQGQQFLIQPPLFPGWQTVSYDLDILHIHWQKVATYCSATAVTTTEAEITGVITRFAWLCDGLLKKCIQYTFCYHEGTKWEPPMANSPSFHRNYPMTSQ